MGSIPHSSKPVPKKQNNCVIERCLTMSYFTLNIDVSERRRDELLPHVCAVFRAAHGAAQLELVTFDTAVPKIMKVCYSGQLPQSLKKELAFENV